MIKTVFGQHNAMATTILTTIQQEEADAVFTHKIKGKVWSDVAAILELASIATEPDIMSSSERRHDAQY